MENLINVNFIKNYMKEFNFSIKSFSEECKLEEDNLKKILNNESDINILWIINLAKAMRLHPYYLFAFVIE